MHLSRRDPLIVLHPFLHRNAALSMPRSTLNPCSALSPGQPHLVSDDAAAAGSPARQEPVSLHVALMDVGDCAAFPLTCEEVQLVGKAFQGGAEDLATLLLEQQQAPLLLPLHKQHAAAQSSLLPLPRVDPSSEPGGSRVNSKSACDLETESDGGTDALRGFFTATLLKFSSRRMCNSCATMYDATLYVTIIFSLFFIAAICLILCVICYTQHWLKSSCFSSLINDFFRLET